MNKYSEVVLPIVEEANQKAFQIAGYIAFLGIILLASSVIFLEVGGLRTTGVVIGLLGLISPFALKFILDKYKKIGVIRFSEGEITTKLTNQEAQKFDVNLIDMIEFAIIDFEGETKKSDLKNSAKTIAVRSGAENTVFWIYANIEYRYQFKLESELEKRKAIYFLDSYGKSLKTTVSISPTSEVKVEEVKSSLNTDYTGYINEYLEKEEGLASIALRLQQKGLSKEEARNKVKEVALSHTADANFSAKTSLILGLIGVIVFSYIGLNSKSSVKFFAIALACLIGGFYKYTSSRKRLKYLKSID